MRTAIYARVSTTDQKCEMQLAELREYVSRRSLKPAGEYVDTGWSGSKASRPEFDRLMRDVGKRVVDVILCWKLDRFGRSLLHCKTAIEQLRAHGVRFLATSQNIDSDESNPTSRFLLHVLMAAAEFERELIHERSVLGQKRAMKNAGNELDDEDLAAYMKQSGLGTPATRAAIIERLIATGYIERKKKSLIPTTKGAALIRQVHVDLKNIALTATWEQRLSDMQDGKLPLATFENDIAGFVARILPTAINEAAPIQVTATAGLGSCPQCKQGIVRMGPKSASCNRWKEGCKFSIWIEQHGKKLSDVSTGIKGSRNHRF